MFYRLIHLVLSLGYCRYLTLSSAFDFPYEVFHLDADHSGDVIPGQLKVSLAQKQHKTGSMARISFSIPSLIFLLPSPRHKKQQQEKNYTFQNSKSKVPALQEKKQRLDKTRQTQRQRTKQR